MSTTFLIFMLISIASYGIQNPLNVKYARQVDALTVTIYRNLSLAITMLPLLFFAPVGEISKITQHIPTLVIASATGVIAFMLSLQSSTEIPLGVSHTVRTSVRTIAAILFGLLLFKESLSLEQLIFILLILAVVASIVLSRPDTSHLKGNHPILGFSLATLAGIGFATTFYFFSVLTRAVHPFVAGYFWEVLIGIFALLIGLGNYYLKKKPIKILKPKLIAIIALISTTTISGTVSYAFAIKVGKYAIATSLMTTMVFISVIAGWFLFKEKPTKKQLILIAASVFLVAGLKLVS